MKHSILSRNGHVYLNHEPCEVPEPRVLRLVRRCSTAVVITSRYTVHGCSMFSQRCAMQALGDSGGVVLTSSLWYGIVVPHDYIQSDRRGEPDAPASANWSIR